MERLGREGKTCDPMFEGYGNVTDSLQRTDAGQAPLLFTFNVGTYPLDLSTSTFDKFGFQRRGQQTRECQIVLDIP